MKSKAHFPPQIESQARASLPVVSADVLLPCQKSRADILERRDTSDKDTGARQAAARSAVSRQRCHASYCRVMDGAVRAGHTVACPTRETHARARTRTHRYV